MKSSISKSLLVVAIAILGVAGAVFAGSGEKFTAVDKLPSSAQKFIKQHYATASVISVQKDIDDDKDYEVIFKDGTNLEFTKSGDMKEVSAGKGAALPATVIGILPATIPSYLKDNYPGSQINSIEPDRKGWKVGLSDKDVDLVFDKKGKYLGAED